ncbi:MAG: SusF/SusE family outer membrane protein, partial [Bacteroidota bacterium]
APRSNEYGRADQAAAWTLMAKLYLNSQVYTGKAAYTECIEACQKVINAGYTLMPEYEHLFLADNDRPEAQNSIIFPVRYDGVSTQTWGGTTFLVHAPVGGSMNTADYGIDFGWGGLRTTGAFVDKFPEPSPGALVSIVAPNPGNQTYPLLYAPGGYQGWAPDQAPFLASAASDNKFEGYLYFPDANTEFKFTTNPDWSVNYGDDGADGTLDANGANIKTGDAGFYLLEVDLNALTYTLTKVTWGLIGSATPDQWNSDQDMTYNAISGAWEITIDLVAGEAKFRANDDWALNYGDDGADALAERNGANIVIPTAGRYVIKLFLDKPDHTYSIDRLDPVSADSRRLFHTQGQSKSISDVTLFTEGYAITKWKNITSTGLSGKNAVHADTDFPMFRIEDVLLMYAEAVIEGGSGGDLGTAAGYVNQIRERAYGSSAGNITANDLTAD